MSLPSQPFIYEGEILRQSSVTISNGSYTTYDVLIINDEGTRSILHDVVCSTIFGGITDNFQQIRRTMSDGSGASDFLRQHQLDGITSVGEKVIIAFLGGDARRPAIIGGLPHPLQQADLPDLGVNKPQAKLKLLGIEVAIDTQGQFSLTHKGAPTVTEIPGVTTEVIAADASKTTTVQLEDDGSFQVQDSKSQTIRIDTDEEQIFVGSDSSSLSLESDSGDIQLDATGNINLVTDADVSIGATGSISLSSVENVTIKSAVQLTLEGSNVSIGGGGASFSTQGGGLSISAKGQDLIDLLANFAQAFLDNSVSIGNDSATLAPVILNPNVASALTEFVVAVNTMKKS